jgi:hypothetical protein
VHRALCIGKGIEDLGFEILDWFRLYCHCHCHCHFFLPPAYCRPTPPCPGRGTPLPYYDFIAIAIANS